MKLLKVAAATPKIKVANVDSNVTEIARLCKDIASSCNPSIIVFPELSLTGYTCGDLFLQKALVEQAARGLEKLRAETAGLPQTLVVGSPVALDGKLLDAAVVLREGKVVGMAAKTELSPQEQRWFQSGAPSQPFQLGSASFRIVIGDNQIMPDGADLILCSAASYEVVGKHDRRKALLASLPCACVYSCNGYGESTDDLVWAGSSLICGGGAILAENKRFQSESSWISAEIDLEKPSSVAPQQFKPEDQSREAFDIQTVGLMSRLEHIHCNKCVIGVSGGLDSTLALLVICEAFDRLGYDRKGIYAVTMPCFGTSDRTRSNAWKLMEKLGVNAMEIRIGDAVLQHFKDIGQDPSVHDVTYENAQARERTQVLMDIGNKVGGIVVGTGDLSEIALGWCTYNGDHMSMYGVNAGVPKTLIRTMVRQIAKGHPCESTLIDIVDTPVSPELVPGQVTEDLLGPYELHDFFLVHFLAGKAPKEILSLALEAFKGSFSDELILKCLKTFLKRFFSQQFKRACSPCGPKVLDISLSPRGDWMMPTDASSSLWLAELN